MGPRNKVPSPRGCRGGAEGEVNEELGVGADARGRPVGPVSEAAGELKFRR